MDAAKASHYQGFLDRARSAAAVTSGLRVVIFRSCSFTSLGALGKDMVTFINAAAGYRKMLETLRTTPRADGALPQRVSGMLRFRTRAAIQAAILACDPGLVFECSPDTLLRFVPERVCLSITFI